MTFPCKDKRLFDHATNIIRRDVLQLKAMNDKLLNFVLKFVDKIKDRVSEMDCENKELVDRENTLKSELVRSRNFISLLEKQKVENTLMVVNKRITTVLSMETAYNLLLQRFLIVPYEF